MRRRVTKSAAVAIAVMVLILVGCGRETTTTTTVYRTTDNGAVVIARENRASGVAAMQIYVRDGALFESPDEAGTANLLRTLVFHDSENTDPGEIVRSVENLGGQVSSAGSHDFVQFAAVVPSENFDATVELVREGLLRAEFTREELERSREDVIESVAALQRRPVDMAYRLCLSELMAGHPYGRLTEGDVEVLDLLTVEDIERRYRERYVGANMLVSVAGDVNPTRAAERLSQVLSELEAGEPAQPTAASFEWPTESRRVVKRAPVRRACQVVGFPGPGILDRDNVTMDVLLVILMEGRSSRLNRRLKEELGLVYSVGAGWYTKRQPSPLFVWMELPEENAVAAETATVELMRELAAEPVQEEELAKAKMQLKVGNLRMVETAEGQAFHDAYWNAIGGEQFAAEYLERLSLVTAEEIQSAAELYLGSGIHLAAVVLPE